MDSKQRRARAGRRLQRGVSLLEGLIASVILLIGLVGVLQGLITASQQNSVANRMTRAGAIGRQTMAGIQSLGRSRLEASVFATGNCQATPVDTQGRSMVDGLETIGGFTTRCVVDLDTVDGAAAVADRTLPLATFLPDDQQRFSRWAVLLENTTDPDNMATVAVVVSWQDLGRRFYHREFVSFYDSALNQTNVEL